MADRILQITYRELETEAEFSEPQSELFQQAKRALSRAYAPYSGFFVSAALRLANGEIVIGTNQENAAYPSGLCAERTAIFFASSQYPGVAINEMVIVAQREGEEELTPACPCGACRQVLLEYEELHKTSIQILFKRNPSGFLVVNSVQDLLPFKFGADSL